nr:serpin-ZX-like [Ipomoea batatas]
MYFFLPDAMDGLPSLLEKASSESGFLERHLPTKLVSVGKFRIPKFKISFQFEVSRVLGELGVKAAFNPRGGGLTEMVDSPESSDLYVSKILQKSFIEVNEEGTEAAAVSVSLMGVGAGYRVEKEDKIDFVADHPFLFAIGEDFSGAILFVGTVLHPHYKSKNLSSKTTPALPAAGVISEYPPRPSVGLEKIGDPTSSGCGSLVTRHHLVVALPRQAMLSSKDEAKTIPIMRSNLLSNEDISIEMKEDARSPISVGVGEEPEDIEAGVQAIAVNNSLHGIEEYILAFITMALYLVFALPFHKEALSKCHFHIPSMCLGLMMDCLLGRVLDMLGTSISKLGSEHIRAVSCDSIKQRMPGHQFLLGLGKSLRTLRRVSRQLLLTIACLALSSVEATVRLSNQTSKRLVLASLALSVIIPVFTVVINSLEGRVPYFTFSLVDILAFITMALDLLSALPFHKEALSKCHFHILSMCLGLMMACLLGRVLDMLGTVLDDSEDARSPISVGVGEEPEDIEAGVQAIAVNNSLLGIEQYILTFITMALDLLSALPFHKEALSKCHFHIPSMCLGLMMACLLGRVLDMLETSISKLGSEHIRAVSCDSIKERMLGHQFLLGLGKSLRTLRRVSRQLLLTISCLAMSSVEATGRLSNQTSKRLVLASLTLSVIITVFTVVINSLEGRVPYFTFSLVDIPAFITMALDLLSALPFHKEALSKCHFHILSMCLGLMMACLLGRVLDMLGTVLDDSNLEFYPELVDGYSPPIPFSANLEFYPAKSKHNTQAHAGNVEMTSA